MAKHQGHDKDIAEFSLLGMKRHVQLQVGYDFYNDGGVKMGRFSRGRYNAHRIQKMSHRNKKSYKWITIGSVA